MLYPGEPRAGCVSCGDADSPANLLSKIPDDRLKSDSGKVLPGEPLLGLFALAHGELLGVLSRLRLDRLLSSCDRM